MKVDGRSSLQDVDDVRLTLAADPVNADVVFDLLIKMGDYANDHDVEEDCSRPSGGAYLRGKKRGRLEQARRRHWRTKTSEKP